MKTILVPVDFSTISDNAIDYAGELVQLMKSKLILMHVYHVPVATAEVPVIMPAWDEIEKDCMSALEKIKQSIHRKYNSTLEIECICRMGFVIDEIIDQYTDEKNIDLVIMGMEKGGYLSEMIMGSNATELIKRADFPVLIINEQVKFKDIKKIVLACDYEKIVDKSILNPLKEFVKLFKSHVYVLNVINKIEIESTISKSTEDIGIDNRLEGIEHSFHFVENEDTITGINEFVTGINADMIVIIPHKHQFLDRILNESNTKRMAFHTSIPLLALIDNK